MNIVDKAPNAPGLCVLTGDIDGPYVDTGFRINCESIGIDPYAYIHVPVAVQIGRTCGMVPRETIESADAEIDHLREKVTDLEKELNDAQILLDAVDTLKKGGYEPKRGPGRPRKQPEVVNG